MKLKSSRRFSKKYKYRGRGPTEWLESFKGKMSSLNPFKAKPCEPQAMQDPTMQGPSQSMQGPDPSGMGQDPSGMGQDPSGMGQDPSGMSGGRRRTRCNRRRRSHRRRR